MGLALVTGTSTGIGLATAIALARSGHTIAATLRNLKSATEIEAAATAEKLPIFVSQMDVDDDASVRDGIAAIVARHGPIDTLVNNAGIPAGGAAVEEQPIELFRRVMETNFFGGLRCIHAVVPAMRERRSGLIVNVTSVAGRVVMGSHGPYAASKFAFEALSEALAQELKMFNVRVAIVEPGVIATPIFTKATPADPASPYPHARRLRAVFAARLGDPTPPSLVADTIAGIVNGDSWRLRYPVGDDAKMILADRQTTTDEEVVARAGISDAEFKAWAKASFGIDVNL